MIYQDTDVPEYDPPALKVLGTLHELTLVDLCIFNKSVGTPDFWNRIPVSNCSG